MVFKIINFLCLVFYDGYTQILYNHTNNKVIKYMAPIYEKLNKHSPSPDLNKIKFNLVNLI